MIHQRKQYRFLSKYSILVVSFWVLGLLFFTQEVSAAECTGNHTCQCDVDYLNSIPTCNIDPTGTFWTYPSGRIDDPYFDALRNYAATDAGRNHFAEFGRLPVCHTHALTLGNQTYRLYCSSQSTVYDLNWVNNNPNEDIDIVTLENEQQVCLQSFSNAIQSALGDSSRNPESLTLADFDTSSYWQVLHEGYIHEFAEFETPEYCPFREEPLCVGTGSSAYVQYTYEEVNGMLEYTISVYASGCEGEATPGDYIYFSYFSEAIALDHSGEAAVIAGDGSFRKTYTFTRNEAQLRADQIANTFITLLIYRPDGTIDDYVLPLTLPIGETDPNSVVRSTRGCLSELGDDESTNPQYEACANCIGQGGIWTAIGCLDTTPIGILTALIRIAFGVMGGVALVQLIMVGLMYQSGQESKIMEAREKFKATIAGIALLVFSVLILRIIGINVLDVIPVGSV